MESYPIELEEKLELADIIDNNKGSFFDALRTGGFQLLLGNEFKGAYVLGSYGLLYQKDSSDIYKTAVFYLTRHVADNLTYLIQQFNR